jgi:hypothetical protein
VRFITGAPRWAAPRPDVEASVSEKESTEAGRIVASVLVIAADPNIESLLGQLVAFAGHRPVFDVTVGAAGESIRRTRPEITILDTSLPSPVVDACLSAADEVGCQPVLTSSTASMGELADQAHNRHQLYFALPGGPAPLTRVLERAMAERRSRPVNVPSVRRLHETGSVNTALCAALSSVARARALTLQAESGVREERHVRGAVSDAMAETRRSHAALRAAVADYTTQLKAQSIPADEALGIVRDAICDCANVVGAESAMTAVLQEAERWTQEAYAS